MAANKSQNKIQHWVPQCYLRYWCDTDIPENYTPYVWLYSKDWSIQKPKAPENIFAESELYTIDMPNGERDLSIEHKLSKLETTYGQVVSKIVKNQSITPDEQADLCLFLSAMHERTPFQRDHWKKQWSGMYSNMNRMKKEIEEASPKRRAKMTSLGRLSHGPTLSMEDVRRRAEKPLQEMMVPRVSSRASILTRMNLSILYSISKARFLTSDNPAVIFDPESNKRHWMYEGGIQFETVEITLPLTPKHTLLLTWKELPQYIEITRKKVELLNQRNWAYARNFVVGNSKIDKPSWVPEQVDFD